MFGRMDGASAQKSEERETKSASRVRMHLQRNGETDWATGVGARQGWDGDESNVSKSKRTVGKGLFGCLGLSIWYGLGTWYTA